MQCLEENFRSKKEELEEKTELLESAQEQVMDLNAQVAMLSKNQDSMSEFFFCILFVNYFNFENLSKLRTLSFVIL